MDNYQKAMATIEKYKQQAAIFRMSDTMHSENDARLNYLCRLDTDAIFAASDNRQLINFYLEVWQRHMALSKMIYGIAPKALPCCSGMETGQCAA